MQEGRGTSNNFPKFPCRSAFRKSCYEGKKGGGGGGGDRKLICRFNRKANENKYLTDVEKSKMQSFEENLRTHFKSNYADLWEEVNKTGDWNKDLDNKFKEVVSSFMKEGSW